MRKLSLAFLIASLACLNAFAQNLNCECIISDYAPCGNNKYFFISYAGVTYRGYVDEIEAKLEREGKYYWSYQTSCEDVSETDEKKVKKRIRPAINHSGGVIIILSEPYLNSRICRWEQNKSEKLFEPVEYDFDWFIENSPLEYETTFLLND